MTSTGESKSVCAGMRNLPHKVHTGYDSMAGHVFSCTAMFLKLVFLDFFAAFSPILACDACDSSKCVCSMCGSL